MYFRPLISNIFSISYLCSTLSTCSQISHKKPQSIFLSNMSVVRFPTLGNNDLKLYVATVGKFKASTILSLLLSEHWVLLGGGTHGKSLISLLLVILPSNCPILLVSLSVSYISISFPTGMQRTCSACRHYTAVWLALYSGHNQGQAGAEHSNLC